MTMHLPRGEDRNLSMEEQHEQSTRCPCRGVDDYCGCQNAPDKITLRRWVSHNVAARLAYADAEGRIGR
jgi:hypothetical protein